MASSSCEISFTTCRFNVTCIIQGEATESSPLPLNLARCGHSQAESTPKRHLHSGFLRTAPVRFFSPVSRRPSVFGHRDPASGSECPMAAFPVPWGYSFRGVIGSSPLAGCVHSADFGRRTRSGVDSYVSLACVQAGGFLLCPINRLEGHLGVSFESRGEFAGVWGAGKVDLFTHGGTMCRHPARRATGKVGGEYSGLTVFTVKRIMVVEKQS